MSKTKKGKCEVTEMLVYGPGRVWTTTGTPSLLYQHCRTVDTSFTPFWVVGWVFRPCHRILFEVLSLARARGYDTMASWRTVCLGWRVLLTCGAGSADLPHVPPTWDTQLTSSWSGVNKPIKGKIRTCSYYNTLRRRFRISRESYFDTGYFSSYNQNTRYTNEKIYVSFRRSVIVECQLLCALPLPYYGGFWTQAYK